MARTGFLLLMLVGGCSSARSDGAPDDPSDGSPVRCDPASHYDFARGDEPRYADALSDLVGPQQTDQARVDSLTMRFGLQVVSVDELLTLDEAMAVAREQSMTRELDPCWEVDFEGLTLPAPGHVLWQVRNVETWTEDYELSSPTPQIVNGGRSILLDAHTGNIEGDWTWALCHVQGCPEGLEAHPYPGSVWNP